MYAGTLILLAAAAAALGACPFSVWIGRWLLKKNIRDYGDRNPGAWNVFRAGGHLAGCLALLLDVGKGIPIVALANYYFVLPERAVYIVGVCAILGHAFSPFLRFRGGKAVAVTYGVMLALPQREILLLMAIFMLVGFLVFTVHSWVIILGPSGSLVFLTITGGSDVQFLFLLSVLVIFIVKTFPELKVFPGHKGILFQWLQAIRH
jgi:glycerol-3-phosphate acyltransferase PlsY